MLLELGSWHWAAPDPPRSVVLGYGSATAETISRGIQVIADAVHEQAHL